MINYYESRIVRIDVVGHRRSGGKLQAKRREEKRRVDKDGGLGISCKLLARHRDTITCCLCCFHHIHFNILNPIPSFTLFFGEGFGCLECDNGFGIVGIKEENYHSVCYYLLNITRV